MRFLPFQAEFEEAIRSGRKTMTTRTRRYGRVGDILDTPFGPVGLVSLIPVNLAVVRDHYWRQEGLESPEDFAATWKRLHPRKGFDPDQRVWLHEFEFLGEKP